MTTTEKQQDSEVLTSAEFTGVSPSEKTEEPKAPAAKKSALKKPPVEKYSEEPTTPDAIVAIGDVYVEPGANPRQVFDKDRMASLVSSIQHLGILNPLTVYPRKEGGYWLVAGERRLRAAHALSFKKVPICIKNFTSPGQVNYARLAENANQARLNPIEFARSIQSMIGQTIERPAVAGKPAKPEMVNAKIASEISGGKVSQSGISQYLALLNLPEEIQKAVGTGKVTFANAREICSAKEPAEQLKIFKKIISGEVKRASDVHAVVERQRATKAVKDGKAGKDGKDGKRRGRPAQTDSEKPDIRRQGLDKALERLQAVKVEPRQTKEVRVSIAAAYERHERAKSDNKKVYMQGVIAALEWSAGLREDF